ncbi:MAG: hypothetical protein CBC05_01810 [Crocinitomicaceae bacterium TMED45]|nr:MAG: hypothetical protein CBC05_01810 [Crocinitomicaceae bacterium TMED45]
MKKFILDRLPQLFIVLLVLFSYTLVYNHAKAIDFKYKEPLTATDKKSIIAFNILQTIDMLQTLEIANNDNYYEKNKILGKHPNEFQVITYFIARGFAHYETTKMIPLKYRNIWHTYNIVYNYDVIRDNHNIGIRIGF